MSICSDPSLHEILANSYHDNMSICSDPSLHEILAKLRTWSKPTVNQSWLSLTGHALDLDGNPTDEGWTQSTVHPELRCACPLADTMDWETMSWLSHISLHIVEMTIYNYDVWMHVNLDTSRSDLVLLFFHYSSLSMMSQIVQQCVLLPPRGRFTTSTQIASCLKRTPALLWVWRSGS